jgi:hypothetical protein
VLGLLCRFALRGLFLNGMAFNMRKNYLKSLVLLLFFSASVHAGDNLFFSHVYVTIHNSGTNQFPTTCGYLFLEGVAYWPDGSAADNGNSVVQSCVVGGGLHLLPNTESQVDLAGLQAINLGVAGAYNTWELRWYSGGGFTPLGNYTTPGYANPAPPCDKDFGTVYINTSDCSASNDAHSACRTNLNWSYTSHDSVPRGLVVVFSDGSLIPAGGGKYDCFEIQPGETIGDKVEVPCGVSVSNYNLIADPFALGSGGTNDISHDNSNTQTNTSVSYSTNSGSITTNFDVYVVTNNPVSLSNPSTNGGSISTPSQYSPANVTSPILWTSTNTSQAVQQGSSALYDATTKGFEQEHSDLGQIQTNISGTGSAIIRELGGLSNAVSHMTGGSGSNYFVGASNVWVMNFPTNYGGSTNGGLSITNYAEESSFENYTNWHGLLIKQANSNWLDASNVLAASGWTNAGVAASSAYKDAMASMMGSAPTAPAIDDPSDGDIEFTDPSLVEVHFHISTTLVNQLGAWRSAINPIIAWSIWLSTFTMMLNHAMNSMFRLLKAKQVEGNKENVQFLGFGGNLDVPSGAAYAAVMVALVMSLPVAFEALLHTAFAHAGDGSAIHSVSTSPMWHIVTTFVPMNEIVTAFFSWFVFRFFIADIACGSALMIVLLLLA